MRSARSPLELTPSCTIPLSFRSPLLFNQPDPGSNNSWILNPNPAIPDPRSRSNKSWIPIQKILDPPSWPNELTLEPGQGSVPGAAADRGDNAKEWHQEENRLQDQLLTPSIPILTCNKLTRQEGRLWLENLCTYIWTSWTHSWFRKKTSHHMCGTPLDSWRSINKNVCEHTEEARKHYSVKWTEAPFFDSERAYWPSVRCVGRGSDRCFGGVLDQQLHQKQQRQRSAADAVGAISTAPGAIVLMLMLLCQSEAAAASATSNSAILLHHYDTSSCYGRMRQQEKQHQLLKCCSSCCSNKMLLQLKCGVMPLPLQCKPSWSKICLRQNLMRKKHLE